jgi:hypothetical protein
MYDCYKCQLFNLFTFGKVDHPKVAVLWPATIGFCIWGNFLFFFDTLGELVVLLFKVIIVDPFEA